MSVRIRAVLTGHSLFVDIYYSSYWLCKRRTKAQKAQTERACIFHKLCKGSFLPLRIKCVSVLTQVSKGIPIRLVLAAVSNSVLPCANRVKIGSNSFPKLRTIFFKIKDLPFFFFYCLFGINIIVTSQSIYVQNQLSLKCTTLCLYLASFFWHSFG